MKSILITIILLLTVQFVIFSQSNIPKIHPSLQSVLDKSSSTEFIDAYVKLKDRYPVETLMKQNTFLSKQEKRTKLIKELQDFTTENQKSVMAFLKDAQGKSSVKKLEVLWTLNYIVFSATPEIIYDLANNFKEIAEIRYDPQYNLESVLDESGSVGVHNPMQTKDDITINPGITIMGVEDVWATGCTGHGVLVASIDEGCGWTCPDLVNNLWQNLGEDKDDDGKVIQQSGSTWIFDPGDVNGVDDDNNGYVDDFIGWDFEFGTNNVLKNGSSEQIHGTSHGTSTACIVVGDGTNGIQTGIAPGAKIINFRIGSSHTGNFLASQYAMKIGVDIITQSQSFKWYEDVIPDYAAFRDMAEIELAAGIIHFNSTSNDGNENGVPVNIGTPGNCPPPWLHPDQTLVGCLSSIMGVGNIDVTTDEIYETSPYGPTAWEDYTKYYENGIWWLWNYPHTVPTGYRDYPYALSPYGIGLIKPDISAPGQYTVSMYYDYNGGNDEYDYTYFSGTSGATPHAAGVAVLLLSANPYLTPADISRIMQTTSVEKGSSGKDNRYGAGRVDAYAAYLEAISELPVELTSFTAAIINNVIELKWHTATEVNNYGFEILRSIQDDNWEKIGFVEGNGNSNSPKYYSYTDTDVHQGKYLYKLKQIDNDGKYEFSDIVQIDIGTVNRYSLSQNYPNPFNPTTKIDFSLPLKQVVTLSVYNSLGEKVTQLLNEEKDAGDYSVTFDASNLQSGVYFYRFETLDFVKCNKMILLR